MEFKETQTAENHRLQGAKKGRVSLSQAVGLESHGPQGAADFKKPSLRRFGLSSDSDCRGTHWRIQGGQRGVYCKFGSSSKSGGKRSLGVNAVT